MADAEPEVGGAQEWDREPAAAVPVRPAVWTVDRMLNFEITDDPIYEGLELQVFDDPAHGKGMAVLLKRRPTGDSTSTGSPA